ncbi:MAG: phage holin family protein [Pseudomonadota bacterium]|nr:phage holin family protein [Pseudomonadota bacterium]
MRTTHTAQEPDGLGKIEGERTAFAPSSSHSAREAAEVFEEQAEQDELAEPRHSLTDDLFALLDDGKTYFEAELAFQKSRTSFVANRAKMAVAYGAAAFGILHLALIAVTVGIVIALAPLVGPWIATLIVGGVLIALGIVCVRMLKGKIDDIRAAFKGDE